MQVARVLTLFSFVALTASASGGCTSEVSNPSTPEKFSDTYQLNELNASYGAFAADGGLRVFTALLGKQGFVRLRGGDTIEVEVNGTKMPTTERLLDDKVHYIVDMPEAPKGDIEIKAAFVRGVDKVVGTIKIAADFSIKSSPPTAKVGDPAPEFDIDPRPDLTKWTGPLGATLTARAELNGPCLEPDPQQIQLCSVESQGAECKHGYPLKLDMSKLKFKPGQTSCEANVQLRLTSGGTPFEAEGPGGQKFKGGGWEGYRTRTFKMQVAQ